MSHPDLQELYHKFDGVGGDRRLAYYGQLRAEGKTHREAIDATAAYFSSWVAEFWPKRGITK